MTTYNNMTSYDRIKDEISGWTMPPVRKAQLDPMELVKMNSGYAIEQHQWTNYHHLALMDVNKDVQRLFTELASQEEEHLSMMGSSYDPETTPMEASLALEMTALQGFSDAAQLESNEACKNTYDYILLDHVTQTKALSDLSMNVTTNPDAVFKGMMQVREGRPMERQFVHNSDLFKQPLDKNSSDPMSLATLHGVIATEEQLHNEFHWIRKMLPSQEARRLFNMITAVENLHTAMLGSLHDPTITPIEHGMINELAEIRIHHLGAQMSKSSAARQAHEYALKEDQEHLERLQNVYSKFENGDPSKFQVSTDKLYAMAPKSANDYIAQIMQTWMNMMSKGMGFERAA